MFGFAGRISSYGQEVMLTWVTGPWAPRTVKQGNIIGYVGGLHRM
jgi:hypothetical protein